MITHFNDKRLQIFFEKNDGTKLPPDMHKKIKKVLSILHATDCLEGMRLPIFKLHKLTGNKKDFHAVTVKNNWRIIFKFENGNASAVEFTDYH